MIDPIPGKNRDLAYRQLLDVPGRYAVIRALADFYVNSITTRITTNQLAAVAKVSPQTVTRTIKGYGDTYNKQRLGETTYTGTKCVTEDEASFKITIPDCESCSNNTGCPLRQAFESKQLQNTPEKRYQSEMLTVVPRNGALVTDSDTVPVGSDFGVQLFEPINSEFASITDEITAFITTGDLGRFEFCEPEMNMNKVSRKVTLTHPDFPGVIFNFSIGAVVRELDGSYTLSMPNTNTRIHDLFPDMGSNILDSKTGLIGRNTANPFVGGYETDKLQEKVRLTRTAKKLIGDKVIVPEIVTYGRYTGLPEDIGLFVYTSPKNVRIMTDEYIKLFTEITPDVYSNIGNQGLKAAGLSRDGLLNSLVSQSNREKVKRFNEVVESKTRELLDSKTFEEPFKALGSLFKAIKFMHSKGLVHLQLHSGNWGLTPDGKVYIGDWETASDRHADNYAKSFDASNALNRNIQGFLIGTVEDSYQSDILEGIVIGRTIRVFIEKSFEIAFGELGIPFDKKVFTQLYTRNYLAVKEYHPGKDDKYYGREAAAMTCTEMMIGPGDKMRRELSRYFVTGENRTITVLPPADPLVRSKKPERNELCSCGSGRKYKHCCGR